VTGEAVVNVAIVGGVLAIGALILLYTARKKDEVNWIVARAVPLPAGYANPGDDVWISGEIVCPGPLETPFTNLGCVFFHYQLEERVRRTRVVNGRRQHYWTWETRENYSRSVNFAIRDASGQLWVRSEQAEFDPVSVGTHTDGRWRHTEQALLFPGQASAVGTVLEGRQWLGRQGNVPLIATHRSRGDYVRSQETSERVCRGFGYGLLVVGAGLLAAAAAGALRPGDIAALVVAVVAAQALVALAWGLNAYNQLISYRNRVLNAWHQVEVELRARYDVVDNLVSVVKAAAEHERSVLEAVTRARGSAESAAGIAAQISAQGELAGHIRSLIALGERYPSLRTHTNFLKLQQQLSAIETKIAYARGFYNESVTEYNTTVGKFPLLIVAKLTGHAPCPHYVTEEHLARGVAEPPHVAIDR